jgi:hypothetical protein
MLAHVCLSADDCDKTYVDRVTVEEVAASAEEVKIMASSETFAKPVFFEFNNQPVSEASLFVRRLVLFKITIELGAGFVDPVVAAGLVVKWWREKVRQFADPEAETRVISNWQSQMRRGNCWPSTVRSSDESPEVKSTCDRPYRPWCYGRLAEKFVSKMGYDNKDVFKSMTGSCRFLWMSRSITVPVCQSSQTDDLIAPAAELVRALRSDSTKPTG